MQHSATAKRVCSLSRFGTSAHSDSRSFELLETTIPYRVQRFNFSIIQLHTTVVASVVLTFTQHTTQSRVTARDDALATGTSN